MDKNWHDWRRQGIGGSDAPVLMGVSPWKTPHQLWQEKVFGASDQVDNPSMKRGRDLEEKARQEFERLIGTLVIPCNIVHPEREWMRASLDGLDITGKIVVEIKCPNKEDHFLALTKKIPDKYYPQVQHQIEVTGVDGMYYFSFDGTQGVIVEVKRDQDYIDEMVEREAEFWEMVKNKTPPELTERDYLSMEGNEQYKRYGLKLLEIKKQKKVLEEKEDELAAYLKTLTQGRSAKGYGIFMQKQLCMGAVDYSKVPELSNVDLTPYRKKSFEKWVIKAI